MSFKCRSCGAGGTDPRAKKHHAKGYCQRCYRKFMKLEKAGIISYEWRIESSKEVGNGNQQ